MRNNKRDKLKASGTLNRRPDEVGDPLFADDAFFDPSDLVQVKYEMLRRVSKDGKSVSESAWLFGFSRPSFYKAQSALKQQGLSGLVPEKPGPRSGHKLTDEVLEFIRAERGHDPLLSTTALVELVQEHFDTEVHPRSMERALARKKKR